MNAIAFRWLVAALLACDCGAARIDHVVVIVQENRTVDNLFNGYPGADTAGAGYGHGKQYTLMPVSLANPIDINHSHVQFLEDYDGGLNDGFDQEITGYKSGCEDPLNEPSCWKFLGAQFAQNAYSYVPRTETVPYWTLASEYAFADETFSSNNGPSYPSHQYMIAGSAGHVSENPSLFPWGCDANAQEVSTLLDYGTTNPPIFSPQTGIEVPGPFPCFQYRTIAGALDREHVSWAYYAPAVGANGGDIWSPFDAIWRVRFGRDWYQNVKSPETRIFNDILTRDLAQVVWISPSFVNSDHGGSRSITGPQWVATIVNAIGRSPYWNSTAIVIFWDDWGGWYDHVVPQQYPDPVTGAYEGLGFRIPLLVVSPYARRGYVSHRRHEIASTLHFIERIFRLESLGGADARADALSDMFDFSQRPRRFTRIPTWMQDADFLRQRRSSIPPDD